MVELYFPAVPGSSSKSYFSNPNNHNIVDSDLLYQHNNALAVVCGGFFVYLLVPKGMKKRFCTTSPRRVVRSEASSLSTTKDRASRLREILPFAKCAFIDTKRTWNGDKSCMTTSPSKVTSHEAFSDDNRKDCQTASHLQFQTDDGHRARKDTPSRRLSNALTSIPSSSARLFSTQKLPLNYGSMNAVDIPLFQSPIDKRMESDLKEVTSIQSEILELDNSKKLLVLISKRCLDEVMQNQQEEALALLKMRRVPFDIVDGMDPMQRTRYVYIIMHYGKSRLTMCSHCLRLQRRQELCRISGVRANYPQFFFSHNDGRITFLGDFRILLKIHHAEGLPKAYRDAHPEVSTWNVVFGDTSQIFSV